jgi:quinol monooxygenase YgiN
MKTSLPDPQSILQQIAAISAMETGKLSSYVPTGRPASTQPYFKLQSWQNGKNITRHVRSEHVPQLQAALDGYARFLQLCDQYAQLMVERTRAQWEKDSKKKQIRPYTRRSPQNSK